MTCLPQGDGAIFDAKWSANGATLAASDSHGHLLLLGLGQGHKLLRTLPTELFYHTDYRPLGERSRRPAIYISSFIRFCSAVTEMSGTTEHLQAQIFAL